MTFCRRFDPREFTEYAAIWRQRRSIVADFLALYASTTGSMPRNSHAATSAATWSPMIAWMWLAL